ncbi:hypothetical protein [Pseudobacteriovorax antillogorgiicola]|uniref:Outer membrane protein beta-barrel domain-containing protein n=1 Tax=Pseudobacteriovorax antillogorgiicola TaxID=1513793 RepID=A0A1Y6B2I0_9BACT|nr:hypothetical protein [Pseudobacteriovorax antillogorgiicola]TCS59466.1 hypothetical protein EDD56_101380 [Pseudobacteriovorax antillogorgiicola]SME88101.1 hypothetical protein SAMN06296036_101105 [Pseudobacteriovorax antillogorgiicola]
MRRLLLIISLLVSSSSFSQGDTLRCNRKQSVCEIQNRRITIGDKIGVFARDGFLVAIGEVMKIRGTLRIIEIKTAYGRILKSHRAEIIRDREAKQPEKFFKVMKGLKESFWGGHLGIYSMGIGDGITATSFEGQYQWKWKKFTYFIIKSSFITGSGEASAKLLDVTNTTVDISVFTVAGGLSEIFRPYEPLSVRASGVAGFGQSSVSLGVDGSVSDILNDRIVEGTVLLIHGEVSAFYRMDAGYHPMVSLNVMSLHNSTNIGFSVGVFAEL